MSTDDAQRALDLAAGRRLRLVDLDAARDDQLRGDHEHDEQHEHDVDERRDVDVGDRRGVVVVLVEATSRHRPPPRGFARRVLAAVDQREHGVRALVGAAEHRPRSRRVK